MSSSCPSVCASLFCMYIFFRSIFVFFCIFKIPLNSILFLYFENTISSYSAPALGGHFGIARSVRLSVCLSQGAAALGYRHAGHQRRADASADGRRSAAMFAGVELPSAGGGISSCRPGAIPCFALRCCRLTFAVGLGNHCFDLAVERVAAEIPQSVTELRRLNALTAIMVELGEQRLVLYTHTQRSYSSVRVRAAVGTEFLSPYPSHTHRKSVGIPTGSPYPQNPQILHTHTRTLSFHYKRPILICCLSH